MARSNQHAGKRNNDKSVLLTQGRGHNNAKPKSSGNRKTSSEGTGRNSRKTGSSTQKVKVKNQISNAARTSPAFGLSSPGFNALFGCGEESASGLIVTEHLALNLAAVYSAVNRIAGAMSTMPVRVIRTSIDKTVEGKFGNRRRKEEIYDHPVYDIFNFSPDNRETTSVVFRQTSQGHALLAGNGCSEIVRNFRGQALNLHLCDPRQCVPYRDQLDGKKKFNVSRIRGINEPMHNDQIFHIPAYSWDGVLGISPVRLARDSISLGLVAQQYGNKFFKNGRPSGFLVTPNIVPEPKRKLYRQEWAEMHEGHNNWQSVGLLSGGMDWKGLGVTPEEAQFLSTRQFQVEEISRWFGMSPHMLGQMAKVGLNITELMIEFVVFTLLPWVKKWEQEANMKLFTRVEQFIYQISFDMKGLLRADYKTLTEVMEKLLRNGIITVNDWRELEERNFFEDCGDEPLVMASQLATLRQVEAGTNANSPLKQKTTTTPVTGENQ